MRLISTVDIFKRSELSSRFKGQPFSHAKCAVALFQLETEIEVATENPAADPLAALAQLLPLATAHAGKGSYRCGIFEIQTDWGIYQSLDGNRLDLERPEQIGFMTWEDEDPRPIQAWTLKCAAIR